MLLIIFIAFALWMYIIFVAADTGYNNGFHGNVKTAHREYSDLNIIKWIVILIFRISKGATE